MNGEKVQSKASVKPSLGKEGLGKMTAQAGEPKICRALKPAQRPLGGNFSMEVPRGEMSYLEEETNLKGNRFDLHYKFPT